MKLYLKGQTNYKSTLGSLSDYTTVKSDIPTKNRIKPSLIPYKDVVYNLKDTRKINQATGEKINPNKDLKDSEVNFTYLQKNIIEPAIEAGLSRDEIDNLLAIDLQETRLGNTDPFTGHTKGIHKGGFVNAYKTQMELADKLGLNKTEALRLQGYNGYGVLKPTTDGGYYDNVVSKFYGKDVSSGIDMKKTPLAGMSYIDLRDNVIKPQLGKKVDEIYNFVKKNPGENYISYEDEENYFNTLELQKLFSKKQQGGNSLPNVIAERGEFFKNPNGEIQQVSKKAPTHDEPYLMTPEGVQRTEKGEGGVLINPESVLSATNENRNQKDKSFTEKDVEVSISSQEAVELGKHFGVNLKVKKTISPSKLVELVDEEVHKIVKKYDKKDFNTTHTNNSIVANQAVLNKLPDLTTIYDTIFQYTESKKQGDVINDKVQQGGYKDVLNRYPTMNGRIPVIRTKQNSNPIKVVDGTVVSMDDVYAPDSVYVKDNKAKTFYNSKLKRYIK